MSATDPRVAVVVPCYQSAGTVGDTIRSVLAQTFSDWALVVVDDGSTDQPRPVVEAASGRDPRVRIVSQPNGGVCRARNVGAALQGGEFVLFLDADDRLCPTMLATTVGYLDRHPHVGAVYTGHRYIDRDGRDGGIEEGTWPWCRYVASRWWLRRLPASTCTTPFESVFLVGAVLPSLALIRRSIFEEAGGWDEEFGQVCEDTDLFLRLVTLAPLHHLADPLVERRVHGYQEGHEERFTAKYERLTEKWSAIAEEGGPASRLVRGAMWFRLHRFYPMRHFQEAGAALRGLSLGRAARLAVRALGEYRPTRPPPELWHDGR